MTTATIGEVAEFINGVAFKESDWTSEGSRIIRIQNLNDVRKPYNRTARKVAEKFHVYPGDILVSWAASLGVYQWNQPDVALLNQHIFRVVPKTELVDRDYLRNALRYLIRDFERHLHGATMRHINRAEFLGTRLYLPIVEEQRRSAGMLDQADALREKRREAIAHLDELTHSIFLDMFGDPTNNQYGWDQIALSGVLEAIESGKSPSCRDRPVDVGEWGVLKLGAVTRNVYDPAENKAIPENVPIDPKHEVHAGDLLFSRKNTRELVAASAYVWVSPEGLLLPDLIFRLKLAQNSEVNPIFLQSLLTYPSKRRQIQELAGGSAGSMPNISKTRLRTVVIERPPIHLQQDFARRVEAIEVAQAVAPGPPC